MRLVALLMVLLVPAAARAGIAVSYEQPGVEMTTERLDTHGTETFDERATGYGQSFTTDFGTHGRITGTYNGVEVNPANPVGGADGDANYAVAWGVNPYTLSLHRRQADGINYFGLWLSALDWGNTLQFYERGTLLFTYDAEQMQAAIGHDSAYFGNPDAPWRGEDGWEAFAFVNFVGTAGTLFDQVRFSEVCCGGFESDNQTVGLIGAAAVPEPSAGTMIAIGLALICAARTCNLGR